MRGTADLCLLALVELVCDITGENIHNAGVEAVGDDEVGVLAVVTDVLVEHGAHAVLILYGYVRDLAAAFENVADGCTVSVRRGSTGWGFKAWLLGKWNGMAVKKADSAQP